MIKQYNQQGRPVYLYIGWEHFVCMLKPCGSLTMFDGRRSEVATRGLNPVIDTMNSINNSSTFFFWKLFSKKCKNGKRSLNNPLVFMSFWFVFNFTYRDRRTYQYNDDDIQHIYVHLSFPINPQSSFIQFCVWTRAL